MTIEVRIENKDERRTVLVEQVEYERGVTPGKVSNRIYIRPKEAQSFHVHLLRELRVSEETP